MSGMGRGRGWLNINKNTKPGPLDGGENINYEINTPQLPSNPINPKFASIIANISLYNENDDGILLNQKLKNIIKEFTKECSNANDVKEAFDCIYDNCLNDEEFASKTIGMLSTASFYKVSVHGVRIQILFIKQFQIDFEGGCKQLQANNPTAFRNSVKMLGDYFHKARFLNGKPFIFLIGPLVTYLEMLLDSNDELDLQLFTVQLYMNGNSIKEESAPELSDILIKTRTILATNEKLTSNAKLWLLMSLDIAHNRFNILPPELHQFYLEKLGDSAMARIRKLTTELIIQTSHSNATLDSIQSNVNVLQQLRTPPEGWAWKCPPPSSTVVQNPPDSVISVDAVKEQSQVPEKIRDNSLNNIGTWEQPKNEKTPRPILGAGAGARVKHDGKNEKKVVPPVDVEWKKSSNWDNKKNKQKKGWEHDDRFENDY